MHSRATQGLLAGIAIAALIAVGGRYSAQYFDGQAAIQAAKSSGGPQAEAALASRVS